MDSREIVAPSRRVARGRAGETVAQGFLELMGFEIRGRNLKVGPLEVDLLALENSDLVVVEVRSRRGRRQGRPDETLNARKRRGLRSAARRLWEREGNPELRLRIDLVGIIVEPKGLVLRHCRNFLDPAGPGRESG